MNFFSPTLTRPFQSLSLPLYLDAPGDGGVGGGVSGGAATSSGSSVVSSAGSGGAGASGTGGGSAGGGTGRGSAGGGTGTGGDQAFEFSDTARIRLADGRVVTGAQYRDELRQQLDGEYRGRYKQGYDLLLKEAQRLDALSRGGQGQPGQGQPGVARSPLADLENVPVAGGKELVAAVKFLQENGLAPMAKTISDLVSRVAQQDKLIKDFGGRFGSADEQAAEQKFHQDLDRVLSTVEIKGFNGSIDPKDPVVRQIAENLYLSYTPDSWRAGEFEKMLSDLFTGMWQTFQKMQGSVVTNARDRLRQHFNPNRGGGRPSGGQAYKFESPREIAARAREAGLFDQGQARIGT